jgi:predicted RNA-binding protein with PIN domain
VPYLIDASNLGGVLGGRGGARNPEAVIAFLMPWARGRGSVTVVFDGEEQPTVARRYGSLEVRWSGRKSADDVIAALAASAPRRWLVVTADRELERRCKDVGARVERVEALVERTRVAAQPRTRRQGKSDKPEPNAADVAHWRGVFGGEGEDG